MKKDPCQGMKDPCLDMKKDPCPDRKESGRGTAGPYEDIIGLPHHVSARRPRMSLANRAAQFTPFKALTGYDDAIEETARLTDGRIELGASAVDALDMKLQMLADRVDDHPVVAVTCFRQDEKKEGGAYVTVTGGLKKLDDYERVIVLTNGEEIAIEDILEIESNLFGELMFGP